MCSAQRYACGWAEAQGADFNAARASLSAPDKQYPVTYDLLAKCLSRSWTVANLAILDNQWIYAWRGEESTQVNLGKTRDKTRQAEHKQDSKCLKNPQKLKNPIKRSKQDKKHQNGTKRRKMRNHTKISTQFKIVLIRGLKYLILPSIRSSVDTVWL